MHLTSRTIDHLPPDFIAHIALFHSVTNAAYLHSQLLAGNTDFEYALIDASLVVTEVHILSSIFRAIYTDATGRLRTRNLHSEIVFCLSPTKNITQSLRRFGVSPTTTSLLAIKITSPTSSPTLTREAIETHLAASVEGQSVPFCDEEIKKLTDVERVLKAYNAKLPPFPSTVTETARTADEERKEIGVQVLGAMALGGQS